MRALVSGATGNVGKVTVELLLANGWEVVGAARHVDRDSGYDARAVDLADPDEISQFIPRRKFDLVVMTHGTQHGVEIGDRSFESWYLEVVDNNLTSAVHLTNHLIFNNLLNPGALIVYCSSIHATQPRASRIPYSVAKGGLESLVAGVAVECAPSVRAIGLRLGQLDAFMKGVSFSPEQFKSITDKLLLPPVKCENIARFCLELYYQTEMTGCIIPMDSGHSLNIWAGL